MWLKDMKQEDEIDSNMKLFFFGGVVHKTGFMGK